MTGSSSFSLAWSLRTRRGSAAELHQVDPGGNLDADPGAAREHLAPSGRTLTLCMPTKAAVVLGSTQAASDIDFEAAGALGLDVVKRRSGGGAVFVDPHDSIWLEAWIPRTDPLWVDDVSASMLWLGRAFVGALAGKSHEARQIEVVVSPYDPGRWGRSICFLSEAPGEVRGMAGKIVGISQRRDRSGARLQAVVYRRWDPARWQVFRDPELARALEGLQVECVDIEPEVLFESLAAQVSRVG